MTDPINFWIAEIVVKLLFTLSVCVAIVMGFVCFSLWTDWQAHRRYLKRQSTCPHSATTTNRKICLGCGKKL